MKQKRKKKKEKPKKKYKTEKVKELSSSASGKIDHPISMHFCTLSIDVLKFYFKFYILKNKNLIKNKRPR